MTPELRIHHMETVERNKAEVVRIALGYGEHGPTVDVRVHVHRTDWSPPYRHTHKGFYIRPGRLPALIEALQKILAHAEAKGMV